MRKLVTNSFILVCSLLLGFLVCEVALRVAGVRYNGSTFIADQVLGWGLRPGAGAWEMEEGEAWSKINRHGFRDRDRVVRKPAGTFRVAVLGDSLTEARQVDMSRTFTALAEAGLNQRRCVPGKTAEVLNFGVGGYGTAQELLQLRHHVWAYSPDLIVLMFYAGNDIFNNLRGLNTSSPELAPYFLLKNGSLELDNSFREGRGFQPWRIRVKAVSADVMNSSVVLQLVYKAIRVRSARARIEGLAGTRNPEGAPDAPPSDYERYLMFKPPTSRSMVEAWEVTEALLTEMGREARAHRAGFLILVVPTGHQIHPDGKVREAYRAKYGIESLEYADDRVVDHARGQNIPVVKLSEPLLAEAHRTGDFMAGFHNTKPNEGHLNERGHGVIARALVRAACQIAGPTH